MNVGTGAGIGLGQLERDQREVKRLHDAFLEALDRHDGTGSPLPEWEDVPTRERQAWRAVDVLVRLRVERAETQLDLVRSERNALVEEVKALRSQVRFLEVLRNQDDLETMRAKLELEALRGARRRQATPPPSVRHLGEAAQDSVSTDASARCVTLTVKAVEHGEAGGMACVCLAVEGKVEVGDYVHFEGADPQYGFEVASIAPETESEFPVLIFAERNDFAPLVGARLTVAPDDSEKGSPSDAPSPITVKVMAVAPDEEGGGFYLAVERGLREVHQGDAVRIQGTGMVAVV
ncbi:hypothetical protein HI113_42895, partial [Corallococcus exiguus]|uniref:hypothetical protein n=1 Tax=Corallococcus exiguus TaxID=83462 RepID=UPI0014761C33